MAGWQDFYPANLPTRRRYLGMRKQLASKAISILLLIPSLALIAVFVIYPLINAVLMSFRSILLYRPSSHGHFVGLQNYVRLLRDPDFWKSFRNTIRFVALVIPAEMLLGFFTALAINSDRLGRGKSFARTLLLLPMMFTPVVVGILWRMLYDPEYGIINFMLRVFGMLPRTWLGSPSTALTSVILADIWQNTPFVTLILLAGLESLPSEPFEAAQIDGASPMQSLMFLIIPMLRPIALVVLAIRTIDAFRVFDKVFVLTMGGPGVSSETMALYAYRAAFRAFDIGYASTICVMICIILLLVNLIYVALSGGMRR
jgi:multiple sugar transport system permease protein